MAKFFSVEELNEMRSSMSSSERASYEAAKQSGDFSSASNIFANAVNRGTSTSKQQGTNRVPVAGQQRLNPDSSAFASAAKDLINKQEKQIESRQISDTSAHAQAQKDSYVTKNSLLDQYHEQANNSYDIMRAQDNARGQQLEREYRAAVKAYEDANRKAGSATMPIMTGADLLFDTANRGKIQQNSVQDAAIEARKAVDAAKEKLDAWNEQHGGNKAEDLTTFSGKVKDLFYAPGVWDNAGLSKQQADRQEELKKKLDYGGLSSAEKKDVLQELHAMDSATGRETRAYTGGERARNFFDSWMQGFRGAYANAAGNVIELNKNTGAGADIVRQTMEQELAAAMRQRQRAETDLENARLLATLGDKEAVAKATEKLNNIDDHINYLNNELGNIGQKIAEQTDEQIVNPLYNYADRALAASSAKMDAVKYGKSKAFGFAADMAKTGLDMAADAALNIPVSGAGLASMAARVYGQTAAEARNEGDSAEKAAAKGLTSALIEIATEKLGGTNLSYGEGAISKAFKNAGDKLAGSTAWRVVSDTLGEGLEEVISDVLNTAAEHGFGWDDGTRTLGEALKDESGQMLYDFLLGSAVGALGTGANAVTGAYRRGGGTPAQGGVVAENTTTADNVEAIPQSTQAATISKTETAPQTAQNAADAGIDADAGAIEGTAPQTAQKNPAVAEVEAILSQPASNKKAESIVESPTLADAFYEVTGIALKGSKAERRAAVKEAANNFVNRQRNIDNGNVEAYNTNNSNAENNVGGMPDVSGSSVEADSGRVPGVYQGGDTVYRGEEEPAGAPEHSGFVLLSQEAKDTLTKRGVAVVEANDVSHDKPAFSAALDAARDSDKAHGWAVTPKTAEELEESGARLIMDANGTTGLAVTPGGDIEAVFANKAAGAPKGATKTTIPLAIANGGTKLDCYGDGLVTLYSQYGFIPVARVKFNPEYANTGWDASKGEPDIFFMMHNGDSADTVVGKNNYPIPTIEQLDALPVMEYDEAYKYRDSLLADRQAANGQNKTASTQETGSIKDTPNEIVAKLKNNIPYLHQEPIVSTLNGNEFARGEKKLSEQVSDFFKSFGNKVFRSGLGNVVLDERGVKSDIAHGLGRAKSITFAAVPDVIASGKQIDFQENWKGRGYDSYVFAAPIKIGEKTSYVAAVVLSDTNNRFYLHEVVDENGNLIYSMKKASSTSRPGLPQTNGGVTGVKEASPATLNVPTVLDDISSNTSIPSGGENVNGNFTTAEGGERYRSNLGTGKGKTRRSQTVGTIAEADITTDERREQSNPYVKNGRFDYMPDTNSTQVERAEAVIQKDGWAKAVADFRADVARGKSDADLVALGAVLLNNAGNNNASGAEYMDIYTDYIELTHRTAGALQAAKIVQQLTPEGRLYAMQRVVDRLNEEYKASKLYAKNANIKIDDKLANDFLHAKDEETRNKCIEAIQQNIADQMPTTFNDAFTAFRYTAMLGNLKTQERNLIGNTVSLISKVAKDRLAAAMEGAGYFFSGGKMERTRSVWAGKTLYKEAFRDFKAHEAEALGEAKYTNIARKTISEIEDKRTIFKLNGEWGKTADSNFAQKGLRKAADSGLKTLERWRKATNWAMETGDAVFSRAAYADAMAGWLKAHKINNFSEATESQLDRARQFAIKEAQEATARDLNAVSDLAVSLGSNWKSSDNALKRGAAKVGEGIVPFRKTPANVAVRAVEYSPLGTFETAYKVWQAFDGKANAADVINSAAKTLTGTGLFFAGIALKQASKLRGKEDDKELDAAQKAAGAMDYSYITDSGKHISLSQFAPMAIPLFMGVRFSELTEGGFEPKDIWAIALGTTDPMLEMSMMQGLNDALDNISDYGSEQGALGQFLTNALESYISQYVPSIIRHIEQAAEKYRQSTYTDKNNPFLSTNAQYWLGKQSAGIPGIDYQQEDYIDMWGRKTEQGTELERIINSFLNPVYSSKSKREPLDDELERLYKAGENIDGFPSVYPDTGSIYQELDESGLQMTREQFADYKTTRGTMSRSLAQDFVDSEEYKYLNDEQRADVLSGLYEFAADTALKNARKANGIAHTTNKAYEGISEEDMPEYLATKQALTDANNGKTKAWDSVDMLLAGIKDYSPEVQKKLQSDRGLHVNKLLYADDKGIDTEEWFKAYDAIGENREANGGSSADWVIAEAIGKLGGSDADKLNTLQSFNTPEKEKNGGGYKRNGAVRRYDAAINSGFSYDEWTEVEKAISAAGGWSAAEKAKTPALEAAGFTAQEIKDIYAVHNASNKDSKVNYLDEYWQGLIDGTALKKSEPDSESVMRAWGLTS